MEIAKTFSGATLNIALTGRLDTTTAPDLDAALQESLEGITMLNFDFTNLEYISSAGLRVLLSTQKKMNQQGKMIIHHVIPSIMEVFEITGFLDILTIEA